jgi:hypothetical protein
MFDDKNNPAILGRKVRDKITGFTGIAVAYTMWLTGCARVSVQPPVDKDGKVPDMGSFDESSLDIVEDEPSFAKRHTEDGGPPVMSRPRGFQ